MTLHFAAEPRNGTQLVQAGLEKLTTRPGPQGRPQALAAVDFDKLTANQPHQVYDLRADQIAGGAGLESARLSGVRYLVGSGGAPVAAAEVLLGEGGDATTLANLNYGPYVEATARAIGQVTALDAVGAGNYEVRALRCAAIYFMALWLKAEGGGADIIYPLAPAPPGVTAAQPCSVDDLLKAIQPLASKRAVNKGAMPTVP